MTVCYNKLWKLLIDKNMKKKDLRLATGISTTALAKLGKNEHNSISSLRRRFIKEANEGRSKKELPLLTDEEEDRIEDNINALLNLSDYSLPTLEISYTADEEDVADIFVRVNSGGQSLTENNFIQTLISFFNSSSAWMFSISSKVMLTREVFPQPHFPNNPTVKVSLLSRFTRVRARSLAKPFLLSLSSLPELIGLSE